MPLCRPPPFCHPPSSLPILLLKHSRGYHDSSAMLESHIDYSHEWAFTLTLGHIHRYSLSLSLCLSLSPALMLGYSRSVGSRVGSSPVMCELLGVCSAAWETEGFAFHMAMRALWWYTPLKNRGREGERDGKKRISMHQSKEPYCNRTHTACVDCAD